ncbi:hypothetical protein KO361_02780 [Candidatus Woesearchaeota archaeon]|nr:hypothetical protein [Candidatus Woesearchaeota archaeon]
MIVKIMSLLDLATAIVMILFQYGSVKSRLLMSFIAYLLIKAFMFRGDFASFLDACIAIYMIFMIFFSVPLLTWIATVYLIQKAITGFIL